MKFFIEPNARMIDVDTHGIPEPVDTSTEKTEPVKVARYAYHDRCTKCGARVHIAPDDVAEKPASIVYNKRFQIIGCPSCMGATKG